MLPVEVDNVVSHVLKMSSVSDMTMEDIEKLILEEPSQSDQLAAMKSMIEQLMVEVDGKAIRVSRR